MLIDLLGAASSEEHLVMVTILLERALSASVAVLSSISWQVLLLSCFFLASKDLDDDPVSFRDLRMLAVMHDVRSAATGHDEGATAALDEAAQSLDRRVGDAAIASTQSAVEVQRDGPQLRPLHAAHAHRRQHGRRDAAH